MRTISSRRINKKDLVSLCSFLSWDLFIGDFFFFLLSSYLLFFLPSSWPIFCWSLSVFPPPSQNPKITNCLFHVIISRVIKGNRMALFPPKKTVCLSVYFSVCLYISTYYLTIYLFVCLSIFVTVYISTICLSVYLSTSLCNIFINRTNTF